LGFIHFWKGKNIMAHLVENMAYINETPWHGLGSKLPKNQPIEVWQKSAGMDFEIKQTPVLFNAEKGDGNLLNLRSNPEATVLYRSDTNEPLSVVSKRYKPVQPREILEFFRDLVSAGGMELETAGVLKNGKKLWALAKTGQSVLLPGLDKVNG
jgi:phage/plasmid-like protein (TIGR03299 family)